MTKKAKKGKGKARVAAKPNEGKQGSKPNRQGPDLEALRKPVLEAKGGLSKAEAEAKQLAEKARATMVQAKQAYRDALAPYRQACSRAGLQCEFACGRSGNVSARANGSRELDGGPH